MGNFRSSRWGAGHTRRAAVEECEKRRAGRCGECGRPCKAEYRLPPGCEHTGMAPRGAWACRRCHDLTYARNQLRRSKALPLLFDPEAQWAQWRASMDSLREGLPHLGLPCGLRPEEPFERASKLMQPFNLARRYTVPARRYKPRSPRASDD